MIILYEYFAPIRPSEDLNTCTGLIRLHRGIFERYYPISDKWIEDTELFLIYAGSPEVETIDEKQALEILERLKKNVRKSL